VDTGTGTLTVAGGTITVVVGAGLAISLECWELQLAAKQKAATERARRRPLTR
jgi:hypothetical protein